MLIIHLYINGLPTQQVCHYRTPRRVVGEYLQQALKYFYIIITGCCIENKHEAVTDSGSCVCFKD